MAQQYVFARVALDYNSSIEELKNITTCASNRSDPNYILHQNVQHDVASWWATLNAIQLPCSCIATLLLGSYSDKGGRKLGFILPSVGALLKCGLLICITSLELPKEVLFAAFIVEGCFGGYATFLMSAFSYISDVTGHRNRALRIVIVETALGIGIIGGQLLFGLLPSFGFMYLYILLAAIVFLMLLYVLLILRESRIVAERPKIFSTEYIKQMVRVYTTNDEYGRRWKLIIIAGILLFGSMMELGRMDVILLFVQNTPLCWGNALVSLNESHLVFTK
jgi:PCFT/HCP family folate transporter-like MFS transporter 1/3